jgi:hypothetical protein
MLIEFGDPPMMRRVLKGIPVRAEAPASEAAESSGTVPG